MRLIDAYTLGDQGAHGEELPEYELTLNQRFADAFRRLLKYIDNTDPKAISDRFKNIIDQTGPIVTRVTNDELSDLTNFGNWYKDNERTPNDKEIRDLTLGFGDLMAIPPDQTPVGKVVK